MPKDHRVASSSRNPLIATHTSPQTKSRFSRLAADRGMTESRLLGLLIDTVLDHNPPAEATDFTEDESCERISLRLRPGDRALLDARAMTRGMRTASYAVMLIRAHVRQQAPMPAAEVEALKVAVSHLTALRRELQVSAHSIGSEGLGDIDLMRSLRETAAQVDDVRQCIAELVRTNLKSWETSDV
jgi:hypothetical protein